MELHAGTQRRKVSSPLVSVVDLPPAQQANKLFDQCYPTYNKTHGKVLFVALSPLKLQGLEN